MIHGKYVEVKRTIERFLPKGIHIYYFCGGRAIGKTYSSLDLCREIATGEFIIEPSQEQNKFLYLRRTGVEAQSVASLEACPFKKYNYNEGYNICADFSAKLGFGNFYINPESTENIGYCAALSTFANLRGVDFSDVNLILYDEAIPENKNKHPLKDEGFLFLNMLETINRNRALEGMREVVVIILSNPIDLASPFLSQLQFTPILNSMIFKNQQSYTSYDRSLHIEKLVNHTVSEEKKDKSMLYKFAKGTGFVERATSGNFEDNDLTIIRKVNLCEYKPYMVLENICVYRHKSKELYYLSQKVVKAKYMFKAYEKEKVRKIFYWLYKLLVIERKVFYDDFSTKVVFEEMIKYKPY